MDPNNINLINSWFNLLHEQNNNFRTLINSHTNIYNMMYRNHCQNMDTTYLMIDRMFRESNTTNRNRNRNTNTNRNSYNFPFSSTSDLFPPNRHFTFPNNNTNNNFNTLPQMPRQNRSFQIPRTFNTLPNMFGDTNRSNTNRTNNIFSFEQQNQRVIPNQRQITNSVTSTKWREIRETTNQPICPITQASFNDDDDVLKINHCGHVFKKNSLLQWFQRSSLCPVCRYNIITTEFGRENETNNNPLETFASSIFNSLTRDISRDISSNIQRDASNNIVLATIELQQTIRPFTSPINNNPNLNDTIHDIFDNSNNVVADISINDLSNSIL